MEGLYDRLNRQPSRDESSILPTGIELLAKCADMEIMKQFIIAGASVWFSPADTSSTMEFFFVHRGALELSLDEGPVVYRTGDSFYIQGLRSDVFCRSLEDTELIYVSNQPMFHDAQDFESYIRTLISDINDKDNYTYHHSTNVMHYSIALFNEMYPTVADRDAILNDMVIAALFHDVGKCQTPDEILKKKGKLDAEQWRIICQHPINSGRLLRRYYSERVAEIAEHHHELLNGSGYPYGLKGEQIRTEARIVAVADAFDAMTTSRGYNTVKSFADAARELHELPELFDRQVTSVLLRLIEEGKLQRAGETVQNTDKTSKNANV